MAKNIMLRRRIMKSLHTIRYPFETHEMATIVKYPVNQVAGILGTIDGLRAEFSSSNVKPCMWHRVEK